MDHTDGPPGTGRSQVLSQELGAFLIQFSIALNRFGMYPDGHPSLEPTASRLLDQLVAIFQDRTTLSLGVAQNQLVIEGVATDPKNPVLRELAGRMHRHHIGAITFTSGLTLQQLSSALKVLSVEADRSPQPLGLNPAYHGSTWEHVRFYPMTYDRLELVEEDPEQVPMESETRGARTRAAQLWIGLARAALAAEQVGDQGGVAAPTRQQEVSVPDDPDPETVAQAIKAHRSDAAYDQVIVGYMLQIADEVKTGAPESIALKRRVSRMVSTLDQNTLSQLLTMGGNTTQRRQFLLSASEGMAVGAVLDLVKAASEAHEPSISHAMLRMLQKLARHAEAGGSRRAVADQTLREQVAELVRGWGSSDPNPETYRATLQAVAGGASGREIAAEVHHRVEPEHMIAMALELDVAGSAVLRAADVLADTGRIRWLLDTLASSFGSAVDQLRRHLATAARVRTLLSAEPPDEEGLNLLVGPLGMDAAPALLDALAESESSKTRRVLLDRLTALGSAVGPLAGERLSDGRWYVQRNMLNILNELSSIPPGIDAQRFLDHSQAPLRREAILFLLRSPDTRDRAISRGLRDSDPRAVRTAIAAAQENCPDHALPLIAALAVEGDSGDLRVAAIKALGVIGKPMAIDALLRVAAPRSALIGAKLPPKSPEYLAALVALTPYRDDPRVHRALIAAARSRDPDTVRAASWNGEQPT